MTRPDTRFDFAALAEHLPTGWRYAPNPEWPNARFVGPDGAAFFISNGRPYARAQVNGLFPKAKERIHVTYRAAIGVSLSRSPRAVAGDIVRRFLPDYLAKLEKLRVGQPLPRLGPRSATR